MFSHPVSTVADKVSDKFLPIQHINKKLMSRHQIIFETNEQVVLCDDTKYRSICIRANVGGRMTVHI